MSERVLVVDDREPLRRRIRSLLEQDGLEVCGEAANGREGIEKVTTNNPTYRSP